MESVRKKRVVTGLSPMERDILVYLDQGMNRTEIAERIGRSYGRTVVLVSSALKKQKFLEDIRKRGETWIGEIPGIPCHCVGALERRGITTVSELRNMPEEKILRLYGVGPKSIEAMQRYKKEKKKTNGGDHQSGNNMSLLYI